MNNINMLGRLVRDPKIEVAKNESFYVLFTLATRETRDKTNFIPCIAFGMTAEIIGNNLKKGSRIYAHGTMQSMTKEDKTVLIAKIKEIEFADSRKGQEQEPGQVQEQKPGQVSEHLPVEASESKGFSDSDISDADMAFIREVADVLDDDELPF